MADFGLSDEEKLVQDMMVKFAREELRKVATEADQHERAPEELLRKGHSDLALAVMSIPESLGGAWDGSPQQVQQAVRTFELSYGCAALALAMPGLGLAAPALVGGIATEAQAKKILEPFCGDSPAWASLALVEGSAGADLSLLETKAEGSGASWKVTGTKAPVLNAARSLGYVVVARASDGGLRVLWVKQGAPGVTVKEGKYVGLRAAGLGKVTFENALAEILGADDAKAHAEAAQKILDGARLLVAAAAAGVAKAALDTAVQYSVSRVQFGEPIGQKQGISFMEADMAMDAEAARLLVLRAASLAQSGKPYGGAAAKASGLACQAAMRAAVDAVQIHGGYGFIREYPVEKWMRDAKALSLVVGAPQESYLAAGATL